MINPFFLFIVTFFFIYWLLSLGWTDLFSTPSFLTTSFFLGLVAVNFLLGLVVCVDAKKIDNGSNKLHHIPVLLLLLGYILNFAYAGEVAIVNVVTNKGSYYKDIANIPTLFPILLSLNVYLVIRVFSIFCINPRLSTLFVFIGLLIPFLLTMGRGIFIISVMSCFFIYLRSALIRISLKRISSIVLFLMVIFGGFSLWGEMRSDSNAIMNEGDERLTRTFAELSEANSKFYETGLPNSILWVYVYSISPLSNLDNALSMSYSSDSCQLDFITRFFLPESFQKNFMEPEENPIGALVSPIFNVSSMFFKPYYYCGWGGLLFVMLLFYFFMIFCYTLVRRTRYQEDFLGLLSVITVLGFFSNMLVLDVIFIPLLILIINSIRVRLSSVHKYSS